MCVSVCGFGNKIRKTRRFFYRISEKDKSRYPSEILCIFNDLCFRGDCANFCGVFHVERSGPLD